MATNMSDIESFLNTIINDIDQKTHELNEIIEFMKEKKRLIMEFLKNIKIEVPEVPEVPEVEPIPKSNTKSRYDDYHAEVINCVHLWNERNTIIGKTFRYVRDNGIVTDDEIKMFLKDIQSTNPKFYFDQLRRFEPEKNMFHRRIFNRNIPGFVSLTQEAKDILASM